MTNRTTQVRIVVASAGYDDTSMYNDKRKGGRRLKFMRNGYRLDKHFKFVIETKVTAALAVLGIKATVAWKVGHRSGYGDYDYLAVFLPD